MVNQAECRCGVLVHEGNGISRVGVLCFDTSCGALVVVVMLVKIVGCGVRHATHCNASQHGTATGAHACSVPLSHLKLVTKAIPEVQRVE